MAAVAAETEELAERAARAIRVDYEVLPALVDAEEAMKPGAPAIYDNVLFGEDEIPIENNVACSREIVVGDFSQAAAEAAAIVEGTTDRAAGDIVTDIPVRQDRVQRNFVQDIIEHGR